MKKLTLITAVLFLVCLAFSIQAEGAEDAISTKDPSVMPVLRNFKTHIMLLDTPGFNFVDDTALGLLAGRMESTNVKGLVNTLDIVGEALGNANLSVDISSDHAQQLGDTLHLLSQKLVPLDTKGLDMYLALKSMAGQLQRELVNRINEGDIEVSDDGTISGMNLVGAISGAFLHEPLPTHIPTGTN